MKSKLLAFILLLSASGAAYAQKGSVSTNLLDYAALGTLNLDISYAFSRHYSLTAGVRYNPFTFNEGNKDRQFQYRQQSYSLGVRMWPWHTWSGWWLASKVRYQEYNYGGIIGPETQEGDRVGLGVYSGYTHMISQHFNIEFGLGIWGGLDVYRKYNCPICGLTVAEGRKGFLLPDDLMIALVYVF